MSLALRVVGVQAYSCCQLVKGEWLKVACQLSLVASGGWKCRDFPLQATPPLYANAVVPQADASLAATKQFPISPR